MEIPYESTKLIVHPKAFDIVYSPVWIVEDTPRHVIHHFLNNMDRPNYMGFPRMAIPKSGWFMMESRKVPIENG